MIAHNTIRVAHDSWGKLAIMIGKNNVNVSVRNNLYLAIDSHVGAYGAGGISIDGVTKNGVVTFPGLNKVDCNTFPMPKFYGTGTIAFDVTKHGIAYVAGTFIPLANYQQVMSSFRMPGSIGDKFRYVSFDYYNEPKFMVPQLAERAALQCPKVPGVFTDFSGDTFRSGSTATAGAYEY